jgi:hypothetical protein
MDNAGHAVALTGLSYHSHDGPMEQGIDSRTLQTYHARLRGGPDDGALVLVSPLPSGAPPDFFHAGPDDPGVYVLAGAPLADGSLPYWFISSLPRTDEPVEVTRSTWTLISIAADDGSPKVWHQHGEGSVPVRLRVERIGSERTPSFMGREYTCPECEETTIISLPES